MKHQASTVAEVGHLIYHTVLQWSIVPCVWHFLVFQFAFLLVWGSYLFAIIMIRSQNYTFVFTFEDLDGITATGCGDIPDVCCTGGAVEEAKILWSSGRGVWPLAVNSSVTIYICDWIWEKPPSMHNYKSLEIPILIIWGVVSREGKQVLAWNSPRFYSYLYSTYAPTVEWIASWIARHFR